MTDIPQDPTPGQAHDCDCLLCGIRRALEAKHPAPLTQEARIDIVTALAYHAGVALESSPVDLMDLFSITVAKAMRETTAHREAKRSQH